jgi:hypothetical protein
MLRATRNWIRTPRVARKNRRPIQVEGLEDRTVPAFVAAPGYLVGANAGVESTPTAVGVGDFNRDGKLDVVTANAGSDSRGISLLIGFGNGAFRPAVNFAIGRPPAGLCVVDLNGDGKLDVVTANQDDNTVTVLLGTGTGGFTNAGNVPAGTGPVSVAAGDFNGDTKIDLAVADGGGNTVTVLLGTGTGAFTNNGAVAVGSSPSSVAVADFNGDHKPDLATLTSGTDAVSINLGTGTGGFGPASSYPAGFVAHELVVGDFNEDGRPDVATACAFPSGDGVTVLLDNPDGSLQSAVNYDAGGQQPRGMATADLNGDGHLDFVTANDWSANNSVSVLLGAGDGTFNTSLVFTAGQTPVAVAVGDLNGDGAPDVVTACQGQFLGFDNPGTVNVLLGNGDGSLLAAQDLVASGPGQSAAADFNGDGKQDLAVIRSSTDYSGVTILLGYGNGLFGPPVNTPTINGASSLVAGDFNGDGKPDLAVLSGTVLVLAGNGDGTFLVSNSYAAGSGLKWIVADTFDAGPTLDLAVGGDDGVSILLGSGGTFNPAVTYPAGGAVSFVATGDFNGDGQRDLVVANTGADKVSVLLGAGNGTFGAPASYATNAEPNSVSVGDFNGDGRSDLAVATFFQPGVTIFLAGPPGALTQKAGYPTDQRPVGSAVTDLNLDGRPDVVVVNNFDNSVFVLNGAGAGAFTAPSSYVVGATPTWVTAADFNGDGRPDLAVTNSTSGTVTLLETPSATASQFRVHILQSPITAGNAVTAVVAAQDAAGRLVRGFTGTVRLTSSDPVAGLPAAYRFTAADNGVHRFTVTLKTSAAQSVTAVAGTVAGSTTVTVLPAAANHLRVDTTANPTAGSPFDVTVTALDRFSNAATDYVGTVHFGTNDPQAGVSLPANYAFNSGDAGVHTFVGGVTLLTAGARTVTAANVGSSWPVAAGAVTIVPAAATQLTVSGPTTATAGIAASITVTARDQFGNVAPSYAGTVHLTTSDTAAVLPADYTFVAGDQGVHALPVVFKTAGSPTVSVSGTGVTGSQSAGIPVKAGAAAQGGFIQEPTNALVAAHITPPVSVQVTDAFGNPVGAGVRTKLSLATNPTLAHLAGSVAYTNASGVATFPNLSVTKGGQGYTLTATAGTGTAAPSAPFTIYATTHFKLSQFPTQSMAGTSFTVTVTAVDAANHTDATYQGTVHFTSTAGALANLPSDYTFTPADAGVKTFTVTLNKAGRQTLTVADPTKATARGTAAVTVSAGQVSAFLVSGFPATTAVNAPHTFMVTARDAFGNTVTNYLGIVQFTTSGGSAVLPAPYTFKATDRGKHTFTAKFTSVGTNQALTVTDQGDASITGTEGNISVV